MKIQSFNTATGIYRFELDQLEADWHAHPAMEVIVAFDASLQIEIGDTLYKDVAFAIIDANIRHKVSAQNKVLVWMVEGTVQSLQAFYQYWDLTLEHGVYVQQTLIDEKRSNEWLASCQSAKQFAKAIDPRVQLCLDYFQKKEIRYTDMMKALQVQTHLSESRLSHLFKKEMGLSLKKYLVWSRLRETIQYVLSEEVNLYEAGLRSGFFDQAHLSKAFKQMLGLSPSTVYNSRMIQE
ncbi:MAG: AraC family transcriptional regulator [Saprospiraceae bacterium]|nr:AraC family transcriptional regulator [Saprospiraceae bacterium]